MRWCPVHFVPVPQTQESWRRNLFYEFGIELFGFVDVRSVRSSLLRASGGYGGYGEYGLVEYCAEINGWDGHL
jgi:hypothetical protein